MKKFKQLNNIIGWGVFIIATFVYLFTMEKTASLWDCGEFIAAAYKLEVVHAPGAPFFLILGRIFSLFAADVSQVAMMINSLSAIASSFTILFLFWTITAFGRKIYLEEIRDTSINPSANNIEISKIFAILGAGVVGSLAYTFSDSFWFSAVEGEVYALSSFFTAITFWCILKWEEAFGSPHSSKWLVLIAYLIGLSIGVHLLSLLTIPAMGMIYYFKTNKYSHLGAFKAFLVSSAILVIIQGILIPKTASLMGNFDRVFVNEWGLPFNSGVIFFFLLLFGLIISGIIYTHNRIGKERSGTIGLSSTKKKVIWIINNFIVFAWFITFTENSNAFAGFMALLATNFMTYVLLEYKKLSYKALNTGILSVLVLLIGYSSYATVIVRANTNTPINIGSPDDPLKLSSYLQRDQYGDWPIVSGQNYNDKFPFVNPLPNPDETNVYAKNKEKEIYEVVGKKQKYNYPTSQFFPRMWSDQKVDGYNRWRRANGKNPKSRIKFGENLRFFFDYQIGWSYMRYFMWNFAGRQNDIQNMDQNNVYGNWESGIGYSDKEEPKHLKDNKGKNHYYFLPLLLGLIGIFFHFKSRKTDAISVLLFFLFTGVLIIVYLNVPPDQPRERDYAYVGSFYAFSIWIGLGVLGIFRFLTETTKMPFVKSFQGPIKNKKLGATISTIICLLLVPFLMASENWDDHDRGGREIAIDVATNYLEYLEPNAIIFTNGDNDTYPLWYAQEVEGIRPDVRVVNMSLLGMDWYINQVKTKVYDADPVPSILTNKDFKGNKKNGTSIYKNKNTKNLIKAIKEIKKEKRCPKNIIINIDQNKIPAADLEQWGDKQIVAKIPLKIKGRQINQHQIALLDILASFDWQRPLYFINAPQTLDMFIIKDQNTQAIKDIGLLNYLQTEGAVTRLVPFRTAYQQNTDIDKSYDNLMNNYEYGNIPSGINYQSEVNVYYDYYAARSMIGFRYPFVTTANALIKIGETDSLAFIKANNLADKYFETFPISTGVLDPTSIDMARIYVTTKKEEGYKWIDTLLQEYNLQMNYLKKLRSKQGGLSGDANNVFSHTERSISDLNNMKNSLNPKEKQQETEVRIESVIKEGNGDMPQINQKVKVHYTGWLEDGTKFDSSIDKGVPLEFIVGVGQVIKGWDNTILQMKVGDKWRVNIPPQLGYGETGAAGGIIPPNANLIFEMELLEIL